MKPVSKTAYYCCGLRMDDAQSERPLCGDHLAQRFMDVEARSVYASYHGDKRAARSNAVRHRLIDDFLRAALTRTPDLTIFAIGAGFETRPYRLSGGHWVELDEPSLMALKSERLPLDECPNKLTRVSIEFETERLSDKLAPFATSAPVVFVFEGVFMYLEQAVIDETLKTVRQLFPQHTLLCDLMRKDCWDRHSGGMNVRLVKLGSPVLAVPEPRAVFLANGYRLKAHTAIIPETIRRTTPRYFHFIPKLLPKALREGYSFNVFEPSA